DNFGPVDSLSFGNESTESGMNRDWNLTEHVGLILQSGNHLVVQGTNVAALFVAHWGHNVDLSIKLAVPGRPKAPAA
ncbi:hypothetical protein, partial [Meiothermus hypogaeus]|uniref:hypothetical protein n=1 Tax=Meiothermus hypogaeus TaxID=884155 RepID=UPI001C995A11